MNKKMLRISSAAHGLLQWVKAIVTYYHVSKALAPTGQTQTVQELQRAKAQTEEELARMTGWVKEPLPWSEDAELAAIQAAAALADETNAASGALQLLPPVFAALEALLEDAPLAGLRLAALDPRALDGARVQSAAQRAAGRDFAVAALAGR